MTKELGKMMKYVKNMIQLVSKRMNPVSNPWLTLTSLLLLISLSAGATKETYSNRRQSSAFTGDFEFEVVDKRFDEIGSGAFYDRSSQLVVRYGVDEDVSYGLISSMIGADMEITVTVKALSGGGTVLAEEERDMTISYSPNSSGLYVDQAVFKMPGYHRFLIEVVLVGDGFTPSAPDNIFIEGELTIDRFYEIATTTPTVGANYLDYSVSSDPELITGTEIPTSADELEIWWDYIEGAEEYELQWTWIDNYDSGESDFTSPILATSLDFSERDFELNNTRIITAAQSFRIPLVYAHGYIIYRVRGVGRWVDETFDNIEKPKYGPWSTQDDDLSSATVSSWPEYLEVETIHESGKNWQYQSVYAEDGKKKEIVSYFDGTLRNRQTVTRLNSNNEAIVGSSIYDNQGRAAIQVLPSPVDDPTLKYYKGLNKNASGNLYTHEDFDWELSTASTCGAYAAKMNDDYGASYYYSENPADEDNWQDYVPDADEYPFVHTIYTPDNTGRIRAQSGVGPTFAIGGLENADSRDRSTRYFYVQPYQEELDRLFGYHVGWKSHYKKNMVVDGNGQVSISIIDPQGRVIATALAGANDIDATPTGTITNLKSLSGAEYNAAVLTWVDLLNKLDPTDTDTGLDDNIRVRSGMGLAGSYVDGLHLNTQMVAIGEDVTHTFDYEIKTDVFDDACMDVGAAYPFAYDLTIDLVDDCGESVLDDDAISMTIAGDWVNANYTSTSGKDLTGANIHTDLDDFTATVSTGSYTLTKLVQVNQDTLQSHLEHYLANNNCILSESDFFTNNVDCYDDIASTDDDFVDDYGTSVCLVGTAAMLADMVPEAQYGATDGVDRTSVFTETNALDWGAEVTDKNWRYPFNPDETEPETYYDEYGEKEYVTVYFLDDGDEIVEGTDFTPEITSDGLYDPDYGWSEWDDGVDYITTVYDENPDEGYYQIPPHYLENLDDFLAVFNPSWAKSLVTYHPEYNYLEYYDGDGEGICTKTYSGTTLPGYSSGISSTQYDNALMTIETWLDAKTTTDTDVNPLAVNLLDEPTASTWEIMDSDPFFNIDYTVFGNVGSVADESDWKEDLMTEILTNFKDQSVTLLQQACQIVICGSDLGTSCGIDLADYESVSEIETEVSDVDTRNQIWETFRSLYISEKAKINQIFEDLYGLAGETTCFYNGYIESSSPDIPMLTGFLDYTDFNYHVTDLDILELYSDAINTAGSDEIPWMEPTDAELFADKLRRFIPIDAAYESGFSDASVIDDMEAEGDAAWYEGTGECPLVMDIELLIDALAETSDLDPAAGDVSSTDLPEFTIDLYEAMGGDPSSSDSYDCDIQVTEVSGDLKIVATDASTGTTTGMEPIYLEDPSGITGLSGWGTLSNPDWDDIQSASMLYFIPGSYTSGTDETYNFKVLVSIDMGSGDIDEFVFDGYTDMMIGECASSLEEANCNRSDDFAKDLTAIFTELVQPTGAFPADFSEDPITDYVGSWYVGSEIMNQLGDDPSDVQAIISGDYSSEYFIIENDDLGISITFDMDSDVPSDFNTTVGSDYNESTGVLTVYYLQDDGTLDSFTATITDESSGQGWDFECPDCDEEVDFAAALEDLYNYLISNYPSGYSGSGLEGFEELEEFSDYLSGGEDDAVVTSFSINTVGSTTSYQIIFASTCTLEISILNAGIIDHFYGFELGEDGGGDPIVTGYASTTLNTIQEFSGDVPACIITDLCDDCIPQTIEPVSCTDKYSDYYDEIMDATTGHNAALDDGDAQFPEYTEEEFCESNLAYVTDAYLRYLDATNGFDIDSPEDDHYITIAEFSATMLGMGYDDGTDDMEDVVDDYVTYVGTSPDPLLGWVEWVNTDYFVNDAECPPLPLPWYPDLEFNFPCEMYTANVDTVNAFNQYNIYLENVKQNFIRRYIDEAITSLIEDFNMEYPDQEYHYTLYYYDQAGNLIQTVPPEGIDRFESSIDEDEVNNARTANTSPDNTTYPDVLPDLTYQTVYEYNSLNQLIYQKTPDGGESRFAYDALGRLVVSQNEKQLNASPDEQFSYTKYDDLGRIIEVGEMSADAVGDYGFKGGQFVEDASTSPTLLDVSAATFPFNLGDVTGVEEVTLTVYDAPITGEAALFEDYSMDNTRNRITAVCYFDTYTAASDPEDYDNASFYDYDVHGNVKELINDIQDADLVALNQNVKKVKYDYELVSGNVAEVTYQSGEEDQFIHKYEYDADNRITNVLTSKDDLIWEQDAKYFYYDHGPLARTEIGDKKVQSFDMAYTIQGWLKGINSEDLDELNEIGKDGKASAINSMNARDAFGYSLHYFEDDYAGRATSSTNFLAYSGTATPTANGLDLYNGNIKEMYTAATDINEGTMKTNHSWYEYDQLNRIAEMDMELLSGGFGSTPTLTSGLHESSYTYDANGNLQTLKRYADVSNTKTLIDDLTYNYLTVGGSSSNRLGHVDDAIPIATITDDLDDQALGNYSYNEIGELTGDAQEEIESIEWKVTGKVKRINRTTLSSKDEIEFTYDAMGNRIMKATYDNSTGNLNEKTIYFRDAQGNVMSIYTFKEESGDDNLYLSERNIYGSSRVGLERIDQVIASSNGSNVDINDNEESINGTDICEQRVGDKNYELSNHLGNVLQVITDRKLALDNGVFVDATNSYSSATPDGTMDYYAADIVSQNDYYPFGWTLPGRHESGDYRYQYNGMEKDNELKGEGNSYDFGARIYDPRVGRWLSTDPLESRYPNTSSYSYAVNSPIIVMDKDGRAPKLPPWLVGVIMAFPNMYAYDEFLVDWEWTKPELGLYNEDQVEEVIDAIGYAIAGAGAIAGGIVGTVVGGPAGGAIGGVAGLGGAAVGAFIFTTTVKWSIHAFTSIVKKIRSRRNIKEKLPSSAIDKIPVEFEGKGMPEIDFGIVKTTEEDIVEQRQNEISEDLGIVKADLESQRKGLVGEIEIYDGFINITEYSTESANRHRNNKLDEAQSKLQSGNLTQEQYSLEVERINSKYNARIKRNENRIAEYSQIKKAYTKKLNYINGRLKDVNEKIESTKSQAP